MYDLCWAGWLFILQVTAVSMIVLANTSPTGNLIMLGEGGMGSKGDGLMLIALQALDHLFSLARYSCPTT